MTVTVEYLRTSRITQHSSATYAPSEWETEWTPSFSEFYWVANCMNRNHLVI
jgi:hypothetical protein